MESADEGWIGEGWFKGGKGLKGVVNGVVRGV